MRFHQFLRVKERESQALRLEQVIFEREDQIQPNLWLFQVARILFPVVFLGWAIFFFAYIFKINYDNLQTMNEKKGGEAEPAADYLIQSHPWMRRACDSAA